MTQVSPPRLLLLVDTYAGRRSGRRERLARIERAIAMAASLADEALDGGSAGRAVRLVGRVAGDRPRPAASGTATTCCRCWRGSPTNTEHPAAELINSAGRFLKSGTTAVLLTPRGSRRKASRERGRNPVLTLPAGSPSAAAWFHFPPGVDFSNCMPWDQQASVEPKPQTRADATPNNPSFNPRRSPDAQV